MAEVADPAPRMRVRVLHAARVGVLSQDHYPHVVKRRQLERPEHVLASWTRFARVVDACHQGLQHVHGLWLQGLQVTTTVVLVLGLVSIWVTPETDVTTGIGLISAGLALALQQVIISLAGYFVILRGDTFTVGDRITLGGVRGDLVRLGF